MIYVIIALIIFIMALIVFIELRKNEKLDEKLKQLEEKQEAIQAQEEKEHEIDQQTVETIEEITTGNNQHDFDAGIGILHDLSGKRKPTK